MPRPQIESWRTRQVHLTILWTLQIFCASVVAIAAVVELIPFASYQAYYLLGGFGYSSSVYAQGAVFLVGSVAVIALNGHEISSYREGPLSPNFVIYSGCCKTFVALAWFVLTIVGAVFGNVITMAAFIFSVTLMATGVLLADMGRRCRKEQRRGVLPQVRGDVADAAAEREASGALLMRCAVAGPADHGTVSTETVSRTPTVRE